MHLEIRGVQEQVVQGDVVESAGASDGELVADDAPDPADGGAGQRRSGAEHPCEPRGYGVNHNTIQHLCRDEGQTMSGHVFRRFIGLDT